MTAELSMEYAASSGDNNDVIFLGDSTGLFIHVDEFERQTGLHAYNLCAAGFIEVDGMEAILKRYLKAHPAPRLVILLIHPWGLGHDAFEHPPESHLPRAARYHFVDSFVGDARPPVLSRGERLVYEVRQGAWFLYGLAHGGLRHYMATPILRAHVDEDGLGQAVAANERSFEDFRDERAHHRGSLVGRPDLSMTLSDLVPESIGPFPIDPSSDIGVDRIIEEAGARGARTLIQLTPVVAIGSEDARYASLANWKENVKGRHPDLVELGPLLRYPYGDFADSYHVNRAGTALLTADLARRVRSWKDRAWADSGRVAR